MAISLLDYCDGTGTIYSATSSSMDSTGADFLIAVVSAYNSPIDPTAFSDNRGNSWSVLCSHTGINNQSIFYCQNPTSVGVGHTFTYTKGFAVYPSIGGYAWSGVDLAENFATNNTAVRSSVTVGSVTSGADYSLFFLTVGTGHTITLSSISGGFTTLSNITGVSAQYQGLHTAYKIQTVAGSRTENPTATFSGTQNIGASMGSFLQATPAGGGGGANVHPLYLN